MGDLDQEAQRLLQRSLTNNTWATYETAIKALQSFRATHKLAQVWPVPIDHIIHFIADMSLRQCSVNTVRTYVSAISTCHKLKGMVDCTDHFLVHKVISGMTKGRNLTDTR